MHNENRIPRKEDSNLAKNDKLKEKIAESRHNEKAALTYVTCGFGALSAALAYGAWQGFDSIYFIAMMVVLIIGFALIGIRASHQRQKRRDWIEQLDNTIKKPAPDNRAEEPTNKEILEEIKKGNKNALALSGAIWGVSLAIAGLLLILQFEVQPSGWILLILGIVIAVFSFLRLQRIK
jgi:4-hydroxybenzoate polyprenyltransferase